MDHNKDQPVYLASYKRKAGGFAGLVGWCIRAITRSAYSHSELLIGNPALGPVHCVTSSGMDGGVRCKRMQINPAHWDVLPMPWVSESAAWGFMLDNKGAKYDFWGVGRFVLPPLFAQHPTRWFCSEAVAHIAGFAEPWRFSPADLHIVVQAAQTQATSKI